MGFESNKITMTRPTHNVYGDPRPPVSHRSLTALAIWSAPNKTILLTDIYKYYCDFSLYYERNTMCWRYSVEKLLKVNKCFLKVLTVATTSSKCMVHWTLHPTVLQDPIFTNETLLWHRNPLKLTECDVNRLLIELTDLDNTLITIQRGLLGISSSVRRYRRAARYQSNKFTKHRRHANKLGTANAPPAVTNEPFNTPTMSPHVQKSRPEATVNNIPFDQSIKVTTPQANVIPAIASLNDRQQAQFRYLQNIHQYFYIGYIESYNLSN